jgi:cell division protein FtsQ
MKLFKSRETSVSRRSARLWMLRLRKFGLIAAVVGIIAGGGVYGWKQGSFARAGAWVRSETLATTASAGFKINDVIVTGRAHIARDDLLKHLAVRQGDPIFGVSVDEAQKSIAGISWVKSVRVTRRLPDAIIIDIAEREPAALWQYQKKISVIDAEGRTLTSDRVDEFQSLPLVVGEDAPQHAAELLGLLKNEPEISSQFSSAVRVGGRRWDLRLKSGLSVKLPENETELALSRLAKEEQQNHLLKKALNAIDLRIPDEMVVEPLSGAEAGKDKNTI